MKALFKLVLWSVGLLLVVTTAAVIIVATLDPNEYKEWLSEQAMERTGRSLKLGGDIQLSYYPWLGLEANDITVGNAAGFADVPFVHADYLKLRIKLLPILKDQYEVDTVSIRGAEINLARNKDGVSNWDDLIAGESKDDAGGFPLAAVVLGGVDVQKASISWNDASTDSLYQITNLDISTDALRYGEPLKLNLGMDVKANKPAISGNVNLDGTIAYDIDNQRYKIAPLNLSGKLKGANIPAGETEVKLGAAIDVDLDKDTMSISELNLSGLDASVIGNLNASRIRTPTPSVQAGIKVDGADLALLFKVVEVEPLASQIASLADRRFKLDTRFDADMTRGDVDVSELKLAMLGARVEGEVKLTNMLSETPGYKGQLQAAGPDLPTLMQVLGRFQGGSKSPLSEYGVKLAKVSNKAFSVNASFDADLKSGDINVPTLDVDTLGIKITGNLVSKDMQSSNGVVNGKLSIKGAQLSTLLTAVDQQALGEVLRSVNFEAGIAGKADDISLKPMSLQAVVASDKVGKEPVSVSLNADTHINMKKETLSMAGLSLKGMGLDVSGAINAKKFLQEEPGFDGQLQVANFNLRALMTKLNQELPVTADKTVFNKLGFTTSFSGSTKSLKVSKLALVLDDTNIKGNFAVQDFDKPAIRFGIDIDQINVDRYLTPVAKDGKAAPVTPETAAGAAMQLPLDTLQALNAKGDLSIGRLTISNVKMSDVKLSLDGRGGQIHLSPVAANLYQGTYSGKISIDANDKLPKLVINSSIKGVQIEPLLKDAMGNADLVGRSDISIAVVARGKDTETFKQTLSGQAELRVTDGVVRGVNVGSALEQVEIMIESKRFGKVNTEGETPFSKLTATLPINAGIVNNSDLLLVASGFQVTGKGMLARLVDMSWKYDLRVEVTERSVAKNEKTYNVGDYHIPIKCRGQIAGENCKPDVSDLAGVAVKKIFLDKLNLPGSSSGGTGQTNATDNNKDPSKELLDKALKSIFK